MWGGGGGVVANREPGSYIGIHDILLSGICFPQQAGELTASLNYCIVWAKETSHETVTGHQETIDVNMRWRIFFRRNALVKKRISNTAIDEHSFFQWLAEAQSTQFLSAWRRKYPIQ